MMVQIQKKKSHMKEVMNSILIDKISNLHSLFTLSRKSNNL